MIKTALVCLSKGKAVNKQLLILSLILQLC